MCLRKMSSFMLQDMKDAEDESPLTNGDSCSSEEELFHLEMSDEGSGGKRPKYHHQEQDNLAASSSSNAISSKDELHGFGPVIQAAPSQKRGAGQPLCTSATEMTSKKARKMQSRSVVSMSKAAKKDLQTLQSIKYEFGDDDPHMAKAAVYYLLLLEDQLVTKVKFRPRRSGDRHTGCPNKFRIGIQQKNRLLQKSKKFVKVCLLTFYLRVQNPLQFDEVFEKKKNQNSNFAAYGYFLDLYSSKTSM